jgi:AcrR family transcriptional regulator
MPPVVNHEAHRERVADVTADLIEQWGLDGVTFREIADAAGTSTAIVSHYFVDKRELLRFVYRAAGSRARQRLDLSRDNNNLPRALEGLLPIDKASQRDWRVWFAFWGSAVADPELAAEQRDRVRSTRTEIASLIGNLVTDGQLPADLDIDRGARDLLVVVMGLAAQAVFDPDDWPPPRQRAFLARHIAALGLVKPDQSISSAPR